MHAIIFSHFIGAGGKTVFIPKEVNTTFDEIFTHKMTRVIQYQRPIKEVLFCIKLASRCYWIYLCNPLITGHFWFQKKIYIYIEWQVHRISVQWLWYLKKKIHSNSVWNPRPLLFAKHYPKILCAMLSIIFVYKYPILEFILNQRKSNGINGNGASQWQGGNIYRDLWK